MSKNTKNTEHDKDTQTLVGTKRRELVDTDTGEILQVDQITKLVYGTKRFWKVYLMDFLSVLGIFDNRQVDVFIYIVQNTNQSDNLFIGTYKKISENIGCSQTTIAATMKKLQEHNFVRKIQNGVWMVNPNVIMRGNDTKRQILLTYYNTPEQQDAIAINRTVREAIPCVSNDNLPGQITMEEYLDEQN